MKTKSFISSILHNSLGMTSGIFSGKLIIWTCFHPGDGSDFDGIYTNSENGLLSQSIEYLPAPPFEDLDNARFADLGFPKNNAQYELFYLKGHIMLGT